MSWIGTRVCPRLSARSSTARIAYSPLADTLMSPLASPVPRPQLARCPTMSLLASPVARSQLALPRPFPDHFTVRLGRRTTSARTATFQEAGGVLRKVADHDVGAGPADRGERLQHRALLVEPAQLARGADHRVLTGDRV